MYLAVFMSFHYDLRFFFVQSIITNPTKQRAYERDKISTGQAKSSLLGVIGSRYRGLTRFELVDRVYTRVEGGIIPIYDVRLRVPRDKSIDDLLDEYSLLRDVDAREKW